MIARGIMFYFSEQINGLVQERHNPIALAMELRFCCTNPSKWYMNGYIDIVIMYKTPNSVSRVTLCIVCYF